VDESLRALLLRAARQHGTPAYLYLLEDVRRGLKRLRSAFGDRFRISYAVKANPNLALLRALEGDIDALDVSSIGEVERALRAGYAAERLSFSGPAKREDELRRAVELGVGLLVCESEEELTALDRLAGAAGRHVPVLLRVNPLRLPAGFGVRMAGKASQFGVDEELCDDLLARFARFAHLELHGFHVYAGTNALSVAALAENFTLMNALFRRLASTHGLRPRTLVYGSGFGIPYTADQRPLDLEALAVAVVPGLDDLLAAPGFESAGLVLETGRYVIGPHGYLLTSVIGEKTSRGKEIRLCDAGFNHHLAAFGLLGSVIRRNWPIVNLSARESSAEAEYLLTGPLCTTIDVLATDLRLPELLRGDLLAIGASGAYGLTASPARFISHPPARELLASGDGPEARIDDVSEAPA
jgi:diaminopimelate decarboxylase